MRGVGRVMRLISKKKKAARADGRHGASTVVEYLSADKFRPHVGGHLFMYVGSHPDNACLPSRRWHEYARRMRAYFMTAHDDDDDDVDDILRLPPGEKAHAAWVSQEL